MSSEKKKTCLFVPRYQQGKEQGQINHGKQRAPCIKAVEAAIHLQLYHPG